MDRHSRQSPFERALKEFQKGLGGRNIKDFQTTTLRNLQDSIVELQAEQHSQRKLQNLNRLQPFLKAIEQYGEVIRTFCNNSDIVAFIWGPLKFLLQRTSVVTEAFCELLGAYEGIGESLPLLMQYRDTFRIKPHMIRILSDIYVDILEFQRIILRYFQQPEWQRIFVESWGTCKSRFPGIILHIAQRRSLIEDQASPYQIEKVQEEIQRSRRSEDAKLDEQNLQRIRQVNNWLKPAYVHIDQNDFSKLRAEYPGTGRWLLENTFFKEWFDPRFPTIPPLLWLSGIPGAGKTILASLVVEEAQRLDPAPTVLYFYCKHDNSERDNFVALGRTLLAQFLKQDIGLLPTLYQKSCRSGETMLTSPTLVEELLTIAFGNCKSAYIILDGLDECPREQRKSITQWFRKLVEDLPNSEPERLRCLFVSQDDGPARKDFTGITSIKIGSKENRYDIEEYCQMKARELKEIFLFPDDKASVIASNVASSVQGLFLLAKLIWDNILGQSSIAALEKELEPTAFPKTINDAYSRIMDRIVEQTPQAAMDDTLHLLGWLVCARRPLKWHEIQGMKSVNLDEQCVDYSRQSFVKSPKDLCASFLETRSDGTIELIHLTAKFFLIDKSSDRSPPVIDPSAEELKIACFCIDYLNLPAFVSQPTKERVLNGDYGFMNYAVLYWLQHLETGLSLQIGNHEQLMNQLAESLEIFIEKHWNSPTTTFTLARRQSDKLQFFKALSFYDRLEQVVASTRRQLKDFGKMKKEEFALNLVDVVGNVREVLEHTTSGADWAKINKIYGDDLFRCPRFSCRFFTIGFSSATERDSHIGKHERPFRCSEENCLGSTFGFSSASEQEKHMAKHHFTVALEDEEFPTDHDINRSKSNRLTAASQNQDESTEDTTTTVIEKSRSESESESEPQYLAQHKRKRQTEFKCSQCPKVFTKKYNLQSHLNSHGNERPYKCMRCGQQFVRQGDLNRHLNKHTEKNKRVCQGCGKPFARADTLAKHYESRVGRACFQRLQGQDLSE
ncbi:putative zinc finger protein [Annulohypoxylon truncatum]|uniref:putative zinc finger protein n=1 Tax=Annulohypoxylon truncatum TaxID=327061 RepID=UPI0020079244|nr:putative zinc finger protein [Annulohypoxylon truncatum]KAI1205006.1 putative zinc finger protein [Annulohypoxylon truncatum]